MRESFTASFHLSLDETDGLLRVSIKDGAHITVDEMKTYMELVERLVGSSKEALVLVDATGAFYMSQEARSYAAASSKHRKAVAFVTHRIVNWFIFQVYILFNRPACPSSIFRSEEKAVEWLRSLK